MTSVIETDKHPLINPTDHSTPTTSNDNIVITSATAKSHTIVPIPVENSYNRKCVVRNCNECFTASFFLTCMGICLTVGLILHFAVYRPSLQDSRYAKGECYVYNNTIDSTCFTNYCDYYGTIRIAYNGLIKYLEGAFTVNLKTRDYKIAALRIKKYDVGTVVKCYYPIAGNLPLTINEPRTDGDDFSYAMAFVLFVLTVIFCCIGFLNLCIAFDV